MGARAPRHLVTITPEFETPNGTMVQGSPQVWRIPLGGDGNPPDFAMPYPATGYMDVRLPGAGWGGMRVRVRVDVRVEGDDALGPVVPAE